MRSASVKTEIALGMVCCVCFMTGCLPILRPMTLKEPVHTNAPDWTDAVPEGMEVKYMITHEKRTDNNLNINESIYQYDDQGRVDVKHYKYGATHLQTTYFYNEDGTVAKEELRVIKNGFTKNEDLDTVYEYNGQGLLIRYLIYEPGDAEPSGYGPYHEYDEEGRLIRKTESSSVTTYQYEGDALVSTITEYDYEWHPTATEEYDEQGNLIHYIYVSTKTAEDGSEQEYKEETFYEYNDKNDQVSYASWKGGELYYQTETEYSYDTDGRIVTEKETAHGKNIDGSKYTAVFETTYTYEIHGLLERKETMLDGKFSERTEYTYEPILVPVS